MHGMLSNGEPLSGKKYRSHLARPVHSRMFYLDRIPYWEPEKPAMKIPRYETRMANAIGSARIPLLCV